MFALDERHKRRQALLRGFRYDARDVADGLYRIPNKFFVGIIRIALQVNF